MPVARPGGLGMELKRPPTASKMRGTDRDRESPLSPTPEPPFSRYDYGGISAFDTDGSDEFTLEDMLQPSESARQLPPPQQVVQLPGERAHPAATVERDRQTQRIDLAQQMLGLFGTDPFAGYSDISLPVPPKSDVTGASTKAEWLEMRDELIRQSRKLQGLGSAGAVTRH